ncbi:MAG: ribosome biogenesis GTP-binding protein YihA/YsxC [Longimicrobiales bacterium]|nr:ribosome biogenesis GTP-binding protein YihA/YsxC [Longimicrobiales bacterium]
MKIRSVEFIRSVADPEGDIPTDLPQVAFSGRSNVGKSSLINRLLRRHKSKIAHVSTRPGKTRTLNFFRVNDRFYLVDLPGYGYAEVPEAMRESWRRLIEGYLEGSRGPRGVVHLVDARHDPTSLDVQMVEYLAGVGIPTLVVLTKIDKLKRSERVKVVENAAEKLSVDPDQVLPFSSKTGEGREALLDALDALLEADPPTGPPRPEDLASGRGLS